MNRTLMTNKILLTLIGCYLCSLTFSGRGMAAPMPMNDYDTGRSASTGMKIASGGLTLLYFPLKLAYAGLGGIVGGMAYVFGGGDEETAQAVWTPAIQGTYILTPAQLQGEEPVEFFGRAESEVWHRQLS